MTEYLTELLNQLLNSLIHFKVPIKNFKADIIVNTLFNEHKLRSIYDVQTLLRKLQSISITENLFILQNLGYLETL